LANDAPGREVGELALSAASCNGSAPVSSRATLTAFRHPYVYRRLAACHDSSQAHTRQICTLFDMSK
jgi:hypothetical protein